MKSPVNLAVSIGCPCGIGPEVSVAAACALASSSVHIQLYGDLGALRDAARIRALSLEETPYLSLHESSALAPEERVHGRPNAPAGIAQLRAIDQALDAVLEGKAEALVTGPAAKSAINAAGIPFVGHTEHLQARTGNAPVVMAFVGPRLRTALVTTHLSIRDVPRFITKEAVETALEICLQTLQRDFGIAHPRIAITGLNPHAGEHRMFGTEDEEQILPAIQAVKTKYPGAFEGVGPLPAEAAFRQARDGRWDFVLAMYHDQATIASKLLDFGDAVNITFNLPILRTSVDHGTGYDIAGQGIADERGMRAAMELAIQLVRQRKSR